MTTNFGEANTWRLAKIYNWRNFNLAKVCFHNKLAFHPVCYTIHMHIVFSIDTPFLAPQNSFRMKIMETHVVESCVRGFHVYQDIWMPTTGERLSCQTEDSNAFDPYAVAIRKSAKVAAIGEDFVLEQNTT